jgi:hypothetical protein
MLALLSIIACSGEAAAPNHATVAETDGGAWQYTYEDVGVACIRTGPTAAEVLVDFGDCLCCSSDIAFNCDVTLRSDVLTVHAGGTLVVDRECDSCGTCEPTTVACDAPAMSGDVTLTYAGRAVPLTLPSPDWTCTGSTAVL